MAFYFEIGGKKFKVKNSVIIGRGAPFTHINQEDDVSRTHAKLFVKEKKLYIEDLDSEFGTYVNSEELEPNQPRKIGLHDNIMLGKLRLNISISEDDRKVKRVLRFASPKNIDFKYVFILMGFIGFISFENLSHFSHYKTLYSIYLAVFGSLLAMLIFKQAKPFAKLLPYIDDIVLGGDGFTIHYSNNESFSVKFSRIEEVIKHKDFVIFRAHKRDFHLSRTEFKTITETIIKKSSRKIKRKSLVSWVEIIGIIICTGLSMYFEKEFEIIQIFLLSFASFFLLHNFLSLKIPGWGGRLYYYRGKQFLKTNMFICLILIISTASLLKPRFLHELNDVGVALKCLQTKNVHFCEQIDYETLYQEAGDKPAFKFLIKTACELKVKKACFYVNIEERMFE